MLALLIFASPVASATPQAPRITPPELVAGFIKDEDYPAAAMTAREQGPVYVGLLISRTGENLTCLAYEKPALPILTAATCNYIRKRFRYMPAKDASGAPIEALVWWVIDWRLDGNFRSGLGNVDFPVARLPNGKRSDRVRIAFLSDETGQIAGCASGAQPETKPPQAPALVAAACKAMSDAGPVEPVVLDGRPVRAVQSLFVGFVAERSGKR